MCGVLRGLLPNHMVPVTVPLHGKLGEVSPTIMTDQSVISGFDRQKRK